MKKHTRKDWVIMVVAVLGVVVDWVGYVGGFYVLSIVGVVLCFTAFYVAVRLRLAEKHLDKYSDSE